jgi:hypothetical protein
MLRSKRAPTPRARSRKDDKKAMALLAERGLTAAERARLSDLVTAALKPNSTLGPGPESDKKQQENGKRALVALKDWYEEWATTARVLVKKRAYLIRMGLASSRARHIHPSPPNPSEGVLRTPHPHCEARHQASALARNDPPLLARDGPPRLRRCHR